MLLYVLLFTPECMYFFTALPFSLTMLPASSLNNSFGSNVLSRASALACASLSLSLELPSLVSKADHDTDSFFILPSAFNTFSVTATNLSPFLDNGKYKVSEFLAIISNRLAA